MNTEINGIILTDESIETIRHFQNTGAEWNVEVLENMIDILLCDGTLTSLEDPKVRLSHVQNLRFLEKLILTFKKPPLIK
jgi:hypothetical protein